MKKNLLFLILMIPLIVFSQTGKIGININKPTNTLDVNGDLRIRKIKDLPDNPNYVLVPDKTGVVNKVPFSTIQNKPIAHTDATRFIGGTIHVKYKPGNIVDGNYKKDIDGEIEEEYLIKPIEKEKINGYTVGNEAYKPDKGGVMFIMGKGFKISNPLVGIYDIKFDSPLTITYGVSCNILDSYGKISTGNIPQNTSPNSDVAGSGLKTNDNCQIGYLSNDILRIKTGDSNGHLSGRSFTFLVIGQ